ncbi:coiled-coil domain-containing protein 172-like isoform X2 [Micropterus salmoides]|uniref:coiled-coil domain-containing protein 172-like isoform X2 n=1 Tax=Micropterus salmoides TaxID=27706 RepID=UPI0018EAAACF|nr:coiled-coil domain-containing protein 172-like isoform X2 [Micropterus salmoides]
MSLDSLFHQILLTEQQLTEQTQKLKEVKVAIIRCNEKIKSATERYEKTNEELNKKAKIKRESKEEEENYLQEISRFNSDFSLRGNREIVFESQTHAEILDLEREVESLYKEMELMSRSNSHMSSMQEEKRALQLKLQDLDSIQKDLDRQFAEAKAMTETLRAERLFVSQKPLTDSTCLRLRKELETHKEGEIELLREALSSEIQFLKSKLDSSQGRKQH